MRHTENQIPKINLTKKQTNKLILKAVADLHNHADFGEVKNNLLNMYKASLQEEMFNCTGAQRYEKFHSFQYLYNFLLLMEMYQDPSIQQINILDA